MRCERGSAQRRLLRWRYRGGEECSYQQGNYPRRDGREAIIEFSHLDAFDSWGTCKVALRRAAICCRGSEYGTGATLSVFHLQLSNGRRSDAAASVLARKGTAGQEVPL